ncbi:Spc98 family-domain-containing protein [Paraphysoderma sedebokerense]|nr:Spc98 family-domain-containing protein [Paraphysoderma sedebokerense]
MHTASKMLGNSYSSHSASHTASGLSSSANTQPSHLTQSIVALVRRFVGSENEFDQPDSTADIGNANHVKEEKEESDRRVNRMTEYCMRILGSRITSSIVQDDVHISDMIKKKLIRSEKSTEKALRFSLLSSKLQAEPILAKRWAVLYFLLAVADQAEFLNEISLIESSLSGLGLQSLDIPSRVDTTYNEPLTSETGHTSQSFREFGARNVNESSRMSWSKSPSAEHVKDKKGPTGYERYLGVENTSYQVPESLLLRDLIYVFQGIDGRFIKYNDEKQEYRVERLIGVPRPTRELIHKLSEMGYLYKRINQFLTEKEQDTAYGLVGQSFISALRTELTSYYRLISILESQICKSFMDTQTGSSSPTDSFSALSSSDLDQAPSATELSSKGLTLRRLLVWSIDPMQRLRMMVALIESCGEFKGGALVSAVHGYIHHGDRVVKEFVGSVLSEICQPLFTMLRRWVYEGELLDPYNEFFVAKENNVDEEHHWWRMKYSVRSEMIPGFVERPLAKKIFLIGKSLNFLRFNCHDGQWVAMRSQMADTARGLEYGNLALLETSIDSAYTITSKRLLDILFTKYKFMDHLTALKRYLLLGQGDFIQQLMDSLGSGLNKPASTLYRHNLIGTLEAAVRASNAQFDAPDILRRLDVRLLEISPGDCGWDVFSLDYHVDSPINTIFTPQAMQQYLKLFNFLWRLKRVEYTLSQGWKTHVTRREEFRGISIQSLLHIAQVTWCEMFHFINSLQYYILFEVLECSWAELLKQIQESATDLDMLIGAHNKYLNNIISRGLLSGNGDQNLLPRLMKLFEVILQFKNAQDQLYEYGNVELEQRRQMEEQKAAKAFQSKWKIPDRAAYRPTEHYRSLESIQERINDVAKTFRNDITALISSLSNHKELNLRFLSFRLNFNEFYQEQRTFEGNPTVTKPPLPLSGFSDKRFAS